MKKYPDHHESASESTEREAEGNEVEAALLADGWIKPKLLGRRTFEFPPGFEKEEYITQVAIRHDQDRGVYLKPGLTAPSDSSIALKCLLGHLRNYNFGKEDKEPFWRTYDPVMGG